jgi:iron-sulfur cluster assembly accessory protein
MGAHTYAVALPQGGRLPFPVFPALNRGDKLMTTDVDTLAPAVTVTDRAAARIAKIMVGEPPGSMLRISVEGGGCSGFQYKFDFTTTRNPDDFAIVKDGATVLVDEISLPYMAGTQLDWVDDLIGSAFKLQNPNATASCGCGTSFTV